MKCALHAMLLLLSSVAAIPSAVAATPNCPAVSPQGVRPPLDPARSIDPDRKAFAAEAAPVALADAAREIVSQYETGLKAGYGAISSLDTISIGISQWNHGTGSLYTSLLAKVTDADILAAPVSIRTDLYDLKHSPSKRDAIIASWTHATPQDPLNSGIRQSLYQDLSTWLSSPGVIAAQRALTDRDMNSAWQYARAWQRDRGSSAPVTLPLLTSFYDVLIYNGGFAGVWVPHVQKLRSDLPTPTALLDDIGSWAAKCEVFTSATTPHHKLYSLQDFRASLYLWQSLLKSSPDIFTDDVQDLLAIGYIRAQISTGDNKPLGFHGIYEVDVLLRRGTEAIGMGYRGSKIGPLYPKP